MIKSITVTNPKGESLKMVLDNPSTSGLYISNVEGLGPSQANIVANELATIDGAIFSSARQSTRNIVFSIGMWAEEDIELMRQKTYRYFPIKKKVTIRIETDKKIVECTGYVESNTPDIFSEQETTQISIICPDPYFYDLSDEIISFSGALPNFEFPFENASLDDDLLEFGTISLDTRRTIVYNGDEDTGININIQVLDEVKNIRINNTETYEKFIIYTDKISQITGKKLSQGDEIYISTTKGNKYIRLLREGKWHNIISAVDKDSDWFQLSVGPNTFNFMADEGKENITLLFVYRNAYGGI